MISTENLAAFRRCLERGKPYFGPVMAAFQGNPVRHHHMDRLLKREVDRRGGKPLKILEIGSWAGGSAITWACALERHNDGRGIVMCIDPWRPYFELSTSDQTEGSDAYHEMQKALEEDGIYSLFLHNIKASGHERLIVPIRGKSDELLPILQQEGFDLIFIDGAHDYASVSKDLGNCSRLVVQGGIICGDDLELQHHQIDTVHGWEHRQKDYILDPLSNRWYHPGVTFAVFERFGKVSERDGFWAVRNTSEGWKDVDLPPADPDRIEIPPHLDIFPRLLEENVSGFNIVRYAGKVFALSLSLGPFDLSSAEQETLAALQRDGLCLIADSVDGLKQMLKVTHQPDITTNRRESPPFIVSPDLTFSRELCLKRDGGDDDLRVVKTLLRTVSCSPDRLALCGAGPVGQYLLSMLKKIPDAGLRCIVDDRLAGSRLEGIPVVRIEDLPPAVTTVLVAETRWYNITRWANELPNSVLIVTLDTIAQRYPEAVPKHAWIPRIESIYPITIPEIIFESGIDLILLDLPARSLAQMPAGFGYVHNALKRSRVSFQTVDLDIILYHRYHSHRILDGLPQVVTPGGRVMPEEPWQPVHYLLWEDIDVIELFREEIDEIVKKLIAAKPKIIAFSLQQANLLFTGEVIRGVRRGHRDVVVVCGGMSCLQPDAARMVMPEADYVVVGEADLVIGPLAESLARGERPRDLPGIWSRFDTPGRSFEPGPLPMDLDELDFPRYDWTDIRLYRNWNGYQLTPIVGSRGCSWSRCTFCGERFRWRTRSPERIVDEIEWLTHQGFDNFVFNDSNLHGDPAVTERMCDEMIRRGLTVRMTAQLRCHPAVDLRYFRKLREAGFTTLRFGVDAASVNTLRLQKKGYTKEMIRSNVRDAARAGIFVQINLVVGVPGETGEDVDETIAFLGEIKEYIGSVEFINPLMLFRGSDYWDDPDRFGIRFRSDRTALYDSYPVAIPDSEWYSTDPYIDKEVRYRRFDRIVRRLREMGVPMGDFANYTVDAVEHRKDLAVTHNRPARGDADGEVVPSPSHERIAMFISSSLSAEERRMALEDASYDHATLISMLPLSADEIRGRRMMIFDASPEGRGALEGERFDLVVVPYGERLGVVPVESLVGTFCQRVKGLFSNGKRRLYEGDDFNRLTYNAAYLRSMFAQIPPLRNRRVLEIGCSDLLAADLVANERPGFLIAVDREELSKSKFHDPLITFVRMDAHSLDFDDGTFDACYSIATLEHCRDPFLVMNEMKRVLRKGGYAYIQVAPLYHSPFGHHMFGYFDDFPWIHLRKTREEIVAYCHERGLDSAIMHDTGKSVEEYVAGMLNPVHVNGKTLAEYRIDGFMTADDVKVLSFNRSYEGRNLLNDSILREIRDVTQEDLVTHGFELVFQKIR